MRDHIFVHEYLSDPLADMEQVPMSTLSEATWLEQTGCELTRKFWDHVFTDGRTPKISHRSRYENHLQHMVEAGLGIMVASAHTPLLPTLSARPILNDPLRWKVSLLVIAGRRYTPALDAFVKIARLRNWKPANAVDDAAPPLSAKPTKAPVGRKVDRTSGLARET